MNKTVGYVIAAILFLIAVGLNFYNEGLNLKTGIGLFFVAVLAFFALRSRQP